MKGYWDLDEMKKWAVKLKAVLRSLKISGA
jgi:hypothetical protein